MLTLVTVDGQHVDRIPLVSDEEAYVVAISNAVDVINKKGMNNHTVANYIAAFMSDYSFIGVDEIDQLVAREVTGNARDIDGYDPAEIARLLVSDYGMIMEDGWLKTREG